MFYNACNGTAPRYVIEQSREWYYVWQSSRYKTHMAEYYSRLFKKFVYINGSRLNHLEPVLPEITVMDFGIDNTIHHRLIRHKFKQILMIEIDCN